MASLTFYGSNVSDATLTTACDMAATTGGTETAQTTTLSVSNKAGEVTSGGGTVVKLSAIPATPTGKGWVFAPGAGTFAADTWTLVCNLACASLGTSPQWVARVYKYQPSTGNYTPITTSVAVTITSTAKTSYTLSVTGVSMTFASGDLLYVQLWKLNSFALSGDNPTVYESTSATQGVASDMQVTTPDFTAVTNTRTIPCTAALSAQRTIPCTASLALPSGVRVILASASLLQTSSRTLPCDSALQATLTRTISPVTVALFVPDNTRTLPCSGALSLSQTRVIPCSCSLGSGITRTLPASAAFIATQSRTIGCTASLAWPPFTRFPTVSRRTGNFTFAGRRTGLFPQRQRRES